MRVSGVRILVCAIFASSLIVLFSRAVPFALSDQAHVTLTANEHPWGRFKPESWCRTQTTITSHHDGQKISSVQELKTTLISVEENGVTLQEEESVTMGGDKIIEKTPKTLHYDFFQELVQEGVKISAGKPTKLIIDKQIVPCEVRIYEHSTPIGRQTTTIWYTAQLFPYVMRVEKVLRRLPTDKDPSEEILSQSVTVVQATSALKSRGSKRTYRLQTTEKTGNVTKLTESRCSPNMPGGLDRSTTQEFDAQGMIIRTWETRLTNFSYSTSYHP